MPDRELRSLTLHRIAELVKGLKDGQFASGRSLRILCGMDYEFILEPEENITVAQNEARKKLDASEARAFINAGMVTAKDQYSRLGIQRDIRRAQSGDISTLVTALLHKGLREELEYSGLCDGPGVFEFRFVPGEPEVLIKNAEKVITALQTAAATYGLKLYLHRPHLHMSVWDGENNLSRIDSPKKLIANCGIVNSTMKILYEALPAYMSAAEIDRLTGSKRLPTMKAGIDRSSTLRMCDGRIEHRLGMKEGKDNIPMRILLGLAGTVRGLDENTVTSDGEKGPTCYPMQGIRVMHAPPYMNMLLRGCEVDDEGRIASELKIYTPHSLSLIRTRLLGDDPHPRKKGIMPWMHRNVPKLRLRSGQVIFPEEIVLHGRLTGNGLVLPQYSYVGDVEGDPVAECFKSIKTDGTYTTIKNDGYKIPPAAEAFRHMKESTLLPKYLGQDLYEESLAAAREDCLQRKKAVSLVTSRSV